MAKAAEEWDEVDLLLAERALRRKEREGGFMILVAPRGRLEEATQALAARFALEVTHCRELIDRRALEAARRIGAREEVVRAAFDAEAESPAGANLRHLLRFHCLPEIERELGTSPRTRLLVRLDAFVRYASLASVERISARILEPGQPLYGLWLLVEEEGPTGWPRVKGAHVPHLGAGERMRVPVPWLGPPRVGQSENR